MFGRGMHPSAIVESGIRDACKVVGAEDDVNELVDAALASADSRPLIVACAAVVKLVDESSELKQRIEQLEQQLRDCGE
jgi:hypothetical protein